MVSFEFSLLPPEIQIHILRNTEPIGLIRLSSISSQYRSICSSEYEYLWRKITFELINTIHDYKEIGQFNNLNKTNFGNWYEVYSYFYKLTNDPRNKLDNKLIEESEKGNIEGVKYLVSQGANIDKNGGVALISASKGGHLNVVEYLVNKGVRLNKFYVGDNAVIGASRNGHLDVIKYLVNQGAYVSRWDNLALQYSAGRGDLDIVKYLVSQRANIHANEGQVLISACEGGHLNVVEYLLNQGKYIKANYSIALASAARNGHLDIVKYLVDREQL